MADKSGPESGASDGAIEGGALVPQPHGGALRRGSQPGNTGGIGRPPSVIREKLRGSFAKRIKILEEIADDPDVSPNDRRAALELMARYGLGPPPQQIEHSGPDGGPIPTRVEIIVRRPEEETGE